LVALATSTALVWRAYRAELEQRQRADANYREARDQRRQARRAVDKMYLEVADKWISRQPQMGELQKQFLQEVLAYYRDFAEENGEDEEARFDKAEALLRVGQLRLFSFQSAPTEVQAPLRRADALFEDLAQQFPDKGIYTSRLAQVQGLLGLSGVEDRQRKLERSVSLLGSLVERYPAEPEYRYELTVRLTNLAIDIIGAGKLDEGERICRRAVALSEELSRGPSPKPEYQRALAAAATNLAASQSHAGNWRDAVENNQKAIAAYQQLTADPSGLPEYQHNLGPFSWHNLGQVYRNLGNNLGRLKQFEEADKAYAKAFRIHTKLVADFPTAGAYWTALFRDYRDRGEIYWESGQFREADRAYSQAVEFVDRMAADCPVTLSDEVFQLLLTCPDPKWRKPERVRELASEATKRTPRSADLWATLGVAHYRLGDYAAAIGALENAMSLRPQEHPADQLFLAMAYWGLPDKQQAQRWYEKAIASMNKSQAQGEELLRYRDEASALLGIKESPDNVRIHAHIREGRFSPGRNYGCGDRTT
jgi:tetratricopeptide (TPR) repeat protein